jgi:hypothetical protein
MHIHANAINTGGAALSPAISVDALAATTTGLSTMSVAVLTPDRACA